MSRHGYKSLGRDMEFGIATWFEPDEETSCRDLKLASRPGLFV